MASSPESIESTIKIVDRVLVDAPESLRLNMSFRGISCLLVETAMQGDLSGFDESPDFAERARQIIESKYPEPEQVQRQWANRYLHIDNTDALGVLYSACQQARANGVLNG